MPYVTDRRPTGRRLGPFTVNIVFTWQGLRALGLPQDDLDSFPEEFRVGMAARKEVLGDSGASDPSAWVTPSAAPTSTSA